MSGINSLGDKLISVADSAINRASSAVDLAQTAKSEPAVMAVINAIAAEQVGGSIKELAQAAKNDPAVMGAIHSIITQTQADPRIAAVEKSPLAMILALVLTFAGAKFGVKMDDATSGIVAALALLVVGAFSENAKKWWAVRQASKGEVPKT